MNQCNLLLIEDNPGDVGLFRETIKDSEFINDFHVAVDGEEGLNYLKTCLESGKPLPLLILLYLNLPKINGIEVLKELKSNTDFQKIPVVILTSSESENDIKESYLNGANSYIVKPLDFHDFQKRMKTLSSFWFEIASLPGKNN